MKPYRDINGDSGIAAYEYGQDFIQVQFKPGKVYEYRASRIGSTHINNMKRLADSGDGLNAYINSHPEVRTGYER